MITKQFIDQYCQRLEKDIKWLSKERDEAANIVSWAQEQIDVLNEAIAYWHQHPNYIS